MGLHTHHLVIQNDNELHGHAQSGDFHVLNIVAGNFRAHRPAGSWFRPTQMVPFMKVPVVITTT